MFSLRITALAIGILCSVHYGNGDAVPDAEPPQRLLYTGKKAFEDGNLIFTVCEKKEPSLTNCTVVQKIYPNKDAQTCQIELKGDDDKSVLSITIGVSTLGKDKAILYWEDVHDSSVNTKVGTVDLKTCKMNVVNVPDNSRNFIVDLFSADKIVTYDDDSFDLYIRDNTRFGKKLGKMEINADGTSKGEPVTTNIQGHGMYSYLAPVATRSASKGYAYLLEDELEYTLILVKPDGSEKNLAKYKKAARPIASASENVVSVCSEVETDNSVTCSQYDEDGNSKFTTTVAEASKKSRANAIQNLQGEGMLVLLADSKPCVGENCNGETNHRIVKMGADGKIVGTANLKELDEGTELGPSYVYKHSDTEYCAAIMAGNLVSSGQAPGEANILHECVEEKDFTV